MNRMLRLAGLLIVLALCLTALATTFSCGDDDDDDDDSSSNDDDDDDDQPTPNECLDDGRAWLAIGEGDRARLSFQCALDQIPDSEEGQYGFVLSDGLHLVDTVSILVDYLRSFGDGGPVKSAEDDDTEVLDRLLEIILDGLVVDAGEELVQASTALRAAVPEPQYEHDGIPLIVDFALVGTMSGEFDRSALLFSESFAGLMAGYIGHLVTISLDLDISLVFNLQTIDFDEETAIGDLIDIVILLLNDPGHPDFLTIKDSELGLFMALGPMIGDGFDAFLQTFQTIGAEADPQFDDVVGFKDENGNGVYDYGEPYVLPYWGELDDQEMNTLYGLLQMAEQARLAYWDRTPKDLDPDNPNPLPLSAYNPLLEAIGFPGILPDGITLPVGDWYAEPNPNQVRDFVVRLINILDPLFPGSGEFEAD